MKPQTGRQQKENFTKPKWKNYDFTMFWSRIITSRYIAVKWLRRVYWLTSHEHQRFFRLAPTILLLRIDDSFRKHRRLFFKSPWMLGEINQLHFQKESFPAFTGLIFSSSTESADNLTEVILHQQTPATRFSWFLFDKTVMPKIPNPSFFLSGRARICACTIEERESMRRSLSLDWYPARKERKR